MKELKLFKDLVIEWTRKAQSGICTDDEKHTYYECAEKLHNTIFKLQESMKYES